MMGIERFPESFRADIQTAVSILRSPGARNIDIAVNGLPQEDFFRAYGQLPMKIDHRFDLVDLSNDAAFSRRLRESGTLEGVG